MRQVQGATQFNMGAKIDAEVDLVCHEVYVSNDVQLNVIATHMESAAEMMASIAWCARLPQPLRAAAAVASELMGEDSVMHLDSGRAFEFVHMHAELDQCWPPGTDVPLDHLVHAVLLVLHVALKFLDEPHRRAFVIEQIIVLHSIAFNDFNECM